MESNNSKGVKGNFDLIVITVVAFALMGVVLFISIS